MKKKNIKQKYLAALLVITSFSIMGYLWVTLVERGLHADETRTGGYTTIPEIAMGVLAILLLIYAIALLLKGARK